MRRWPPQYGHICMDEWPPILAEAGIDVWPALHLASAGLVISIGKDTPASPATRQGCVNLLEDIRRFLTQQCLLAVEYGPLEGRVTHG